MVYNRTTAVKEEMISSPEKTDSFGVDCPPVGRDLESAYLELLKRSLCNLIHFETEIRPKTDNKKVRRALVRLINSLSSRRSELVLIDKSQRDPRQRLEGRDWPVSGQTMVGLARLDNIQRCLAQIFADKVPGDIIEAGVWRGGSSIFMQAVLRINGETERNVWLADSFQGLPAPDEAKYPADKGMPLHLFQELAVPLEAVRANFDRYGLMGENVRFLKGWFSETLPKAPIEKLALIRADGDMYESTTDILTNLYPKLSPGGFIIIDDYQIPACRQAVADYRGKHGITEPIEAIDWAGVYWRRSK